MPITAAAAVIPRALVDRGSVAIPRSGPGCRRLAGGRAAATGPRPAEYQRRLDEAHSGGHERADIATLEAQMAKLRRGIGRLIDSYAEGMIDKVDFDPRITGLRQRLVNLEDCCKVLRDQAAVQTTLSLIIGRLEDFADHVRDTLSASDWHQRRELIRLLVKRVEIDVDAINIVFRVAPAPSGPGPAELRSPSSQDCGWRGHHGIRMALVQGGVHVGSVIAAVAQEELDRLGDLVEQGLDLRSLIDVAVGQDGSDDPAGHRVKADVQLAPGAPLAGTMLLDQPLARAAQLQPRTVDQQVDRSA